MSSATGGPGRSLFACRGLALGYAGEPVLSDVEWQVEAGESWFLLGPNGSGKTTLLQGVLGLLAPLAGSVERDEPERFLERTGFVPQRGRSHPRLPTTVHEFVGLGLVGIPPDERRPDSLAWALDRVGLAGLAGRDLRDLSGGQRQRASVARALVRRPRLLLLDEPTEGLDVATEESFLRTLDELHRSEALTLLFVTHKLDVAARYATHVALFREGAVSAGRRDAVLGAADLEAAFGVPRERLHELRL